MGAVLRPFPRKTSFFSCRRPKKRLTEVLFLPSAFQHGLDGNGTIVSMNADELILEKEYFSSYTLDEPSYKAGFAGLTADSFTGEDTLISGATISSNAVKTAVYDVFAAFKNLQENGGL